MKRKTIITTLCLFAAGTAANAEPGLNPREGGFTWTRTDRFAAGSLGIERSYDSRSAHPGILGLGWCSQLEWEVRTRDAVPRLFRCDRRESLPVRPEKDGFSIRWKNTLLTFDTGGRLSSLGPPSARWRVERDDRARISALRPTSGKAVLARYSPRTGLLEKLIRGGEGPVFEIRSNHLEAVRGTGTDELYLYNHFSNMIFARSGSREVRVSYDDLQDVVLTFAEKGCLTTASYSTRRESGVVRDRVVTLEKCPGKPAISQSRDFEYAPPRATSSTASPRSRKEKK